MVEVVLTVVVRNIAVVGLEVLVVEVGFDVVGSVYVVVVVPLVVELVNTPLAAFLEESCPHLRIREVCSTCTYFIFKYAIPPLVAVTPVSLPPDVRPVLMSLCGAPEPSPRVCRVRARPVDEAVEGKGKRAGDTDLRPAGDSAVAHGWGRGLRVEAEDQAEGQHEEWRRLPKHVVLGDQLFEK